MELLRLLLWVLWCGLLCSLAKGEKSILDSWTQYTQQIHEPDSSRPFFEETKKLKALAPDQWSQHTQQIYEPDSPIPSVEEIEKLNAFYLDQWSQHTQEKYEPVSQRTFAEEVRNAFTKAVENLKARTADRIRRPPKVQARGPITRHRLLQQASPLSRLRMQVQEVFEETTIVFITSCSSTVQQVVYELPRTDLKGILGEDTAEIQSCEAALQIEECDRNSRYRTMDGSCNNLGNPSWGMTSSCFQRLLEPSYSDGVSELRTARSGWPLPNARRISLGIHDHLHNPTYDITHMFMQWGQFLDHDISLSPLFTDPVNNEQPTCCGEEAARATECLPIVLEFGDPFFSHFNISCLENVRTGACSTCGLGPRQQLNQLTSYIDASQVYETSVNQSRGLRTLDGTGKLSSQFSIYAGELLPRSFQQANDECSFQAPENLSCFQAGDRRVNQQPTLASLHTLFLREHNRIARILRDMNPSWDDEILYQEARRIVGAEMQMITYNEFLPLIIGPGMMDRFGLNVGVIGYTQYDENVQATILNEFSTAAYRFGHSMINRFFADLSSTSGYLLKDIFFYPFGLYEGQMEGVLLGLTRSPSQKSDRHMVPDVTNHLYQVRGNRTGFDLAAMNILRGRDHGLRGYTDYLRYFGGPEITYFNDLDGHFQTGAREIFERIYETPEDIDLFSGGLAENPVPGGVVGPTFANIMGIQFQRLKYGDRFYFEHGGQTGSFTEGQLAELRKISLAKIICENTRITEIQPHVMECSNDRNPILHCNHIEGMDLGPWGDSKRLRNRCHGCKI